MMVEQLIPVITIDGPSGSGKGTVAQAIAHKYGWNYLDSGALYRLLALKLIKEERQEIDLEDLIAAAKTLNIKFEWSSEHNKFVIYLDNQLIMNELRTEECSRLASKIASIPSLRAELINLQHSFLQPPGLITDGRDMGTIIFPTAPLKIFLTANAKERANRRLQQLQEQGENAKFFNLLQKIKERDARDQNRKVAPLQPAPDANVIDSSSLSVNQVIEKITKLANKSKLLD